MTCPDCNGSGERIDGGTPGPCSHRRSSSPSSPGPGDPTKEADEAGMEPKMSYAHDSAELDRARQEARETLARQQEAAEAKDKAEGGLERRYHVERLNDTAGKHTDCRFFVLDPQHDPIAREALRTYANHAYAKGYVTLHDDLMRWLRDL